MGSHRTALIYAIPHNLSRTAAPAPYRPSPQALSSRWRWLQAAFFYVGAPAHILSRVWPVLLVNMLPMLLVIADLLVRVGQNEAAVAAGRRVPRTQLGVLPEVSAGLTGSLESLFRYLLFAVSLLLTLRLNRVYDRCARPRAGMRPGVSVALAPSGAPRGGRPQLVSCTIPDSSARGLRSLPRAITSQLVAGTAGV